MTNPNVLEFAKNVTINGKRLNDISEGVISATFSNSTSEVSTITIMVDDPGLIKYRGSVFPLDGLLKFSGNSYRISSINIEGGPATSGQVTFDARPLAFRLLKLRKGPLVMKNVTPSQFVEAECKAVGAPFFTQPTSRRTSVSRDVTVVGEKGNADSTSWSTFARLAAEEGFYFFESNGTIIFAKPSYIISKRPAAIVGWVDEEEKYKPYDIPNCHATLDDVHSVTVDVNLPISRVAEFPVGNVLDLRNVGSPYDGKYLIDNVSYNLINPATFNVTGVRPADPEKQATA